MMPLMHIVIIYHGSCYNNIMTLQLLTVHQLLSHKGGRGGPPLGSESSAGKQCIVHVIVVI